MKRWLPLLFVASLCLLAPAGSAWATDAPTPAPSVTPAPVPDTFLWMHRGNRWLASSLSLGVTGLGQLYNNEPEKGYGMMATWLGYPLGYGLDALTGKAYGRLFTYAVAVGVKVWSVTDAWQNAEPPPPPVPTPVPSAPAPVPSHP